MRVLMLLHRDKISPPASDRRFWLRFLQHASKSLVIQQEFKGKALKLRAPENAVRKLRLIFAAAVLAKIRVD